MSENKIVLDEGGHVKIPTLQFNILIEEKKNFNSENHSVLIGLVGWIVSSTEKLWKKFGFPYCLARFIRKPLIWREKSRDKYFGRKIVENKDYYKGKTRVWYSAVLFNIYFNHFLEDKMVG